MAEDDEQPVTVEDMLEYLNLDETPENKETIGDLIQGAKTLILDSFDSDGLTASTLNSDQIYTQAIRGLVASWYKDRSGTDGVPLGVQILITHLQGRYSQWPDENQNG